MESLLKRVYLIEDDTKLCEDFKKILANRNDYTLAGITDDITTAYEDIMNDPPEIILLDLCLKKKEGGEYDGVQLVEQLKGCFTHPPCIIIISIIQEEHIIESLYNKGVDYRFDKNEPDFSAELIVKHLEDIYDCIKKPKTKSDVLHIARCELVES